MNKNKVKTVDVFVDNLRYLMGSNGINQAQLSKKTGVSQKSISNILASEQIPSIEIVEKLASAFDLEPWHLMVSNLPNDLKSNDSIERLCHYFIRSTEEGRKHIERVAEREAEYSVARLSQ